MKHVKSITYKPKIEAILTGDCRQTIRKGNKVSVGDEILFHGWEGKPYISKWSWRKRVKVNEVYQLVLDYETLTFINDNCENDIYKWDSTIVSLIAKEDYIDPPTGIELRNVLFGLNKTPKEPEIYQIIRW